MRSELENLIYNNTLFCAIIFIPFVEPLYFTQIVLVDTLFLYWKLAAIALIAGVWTLHFRGGKVLLGLAIFLILDCIVTTVNAGNILQMYINAITLFAMAIMFMTAAEKGSYKFIKVASSVLEILIIINLLTIILFPEGLYNFTAVNHHYFLGSRNVMMRTIFPGVCFSILRSKIERGKMSFRTIIVMIAAGASLVLVWSATALFSYALFCALMFIFQFKGAPKWFTVKTCYIISIVIFLFIVVLHLQDMFSFIIVGVLQKDVTFTGRTILWDAAMLNIAKSPLWGYGLENLQTIAAKLYSYTEYDSCHNLYLDVLYQNGIIGFGLLCILFGAVAKKVDHYLSERYRTVFTLFIFTYAIMVNFEPFINGDMRLFVSMFFFMNYFNESAIEKRTSNLRYKVIKLGSIRLN